MLIKRKSLILSLGLILLAQGLSFAEPNLTVTATVELVKAKDESLVPPPPPPASVASPVTNAAAASAAVGVPPPAPAGEASYLPTAPVVFAKPDNRSVELTWSPSVGRFPIVGYFIFRGTAPGALDPAPINKLSVMDTSFSDNGEISVSAPQNRMTYYYGVRAADQDGRLSPMSEIVSATPSGPLLPPNKIMVSQQDGKVTLSWEEPVSTGENDLSAYQVFRSEKTGQYGEAIAVMSLTSTAYGDSLPNGKTFYYVLRSVDQTGGISGPSAELEATAYKALAAPKNLSGRGVGDESVALKWDAPAGKGTFNLNGYNVYRSTNSPVDVSAHPINRSLIEKSSYNDEPENSSPPPKLGTLYYYSVVAVDTKANPSSPSEPIATSPTASITRLSASDMEIPGTGGSTLSIQGKKTLDLGYTFVSKSDPAASTGYANGVGEGFQIDQQLQVRLTGKVGRKIKVDVDYDDKAISADQQQKISVVYTGDQQEVFKEFSFGDIVMDLTSGRTEFAGYNKSLFGAKVKLESPDGRFRFTAVGAQTKGFTETKTIIGGTQPATTGNTPGRDVLDSSYTPYRYYYLSREPELIEKHTKFIKPGSVIIYIDQPGYTVASPNKVVVPDRTGNSSFNFVQLVPGTQYSVDTYTGLVTFTNVNVRREDNIAVAYIVVDAATGSETSVGYSSYPNFDWSPSGLDSDIATGTCGHPVQIQPGLILTPHMIQYGSKYASSSYDSHMSFQFYNLGVQNILNPKLDPDFKLVIYGTDQKPVYQLDSRSDFTNVVDFDARLGIMKFRTFFPLKKGLSSPSDLQMDIGNFSKVNETMNNSQQDIYNASTTQHNFTIHLEYKYKVASYTLRLNIIRGSEVITMDGRRLARDTDYYLDYESGSLVFTNPSSIRDTSVIQATYEYLPFGGHFTSTIWGARGEYDVASNLSIGSTFIVNSSDAPQDTPDVRSTPYSLTVLDGDVLASFSRERISDLLSGITGNRTVPLALTVKGEVAHSWFNPNTFNQHNETGVAMIDNFEGVDNIVSLTTEENSWFPSSRPLVSSADASGGMPGIDRTFSKQVNELTPPHDSSERVAQGESPTMNMMTISYQGFNTPGNWDAFVTPFPGTGKSLSEFTDMQVIARSDGDITLHVDVGRVNEDATDNGVLDSESLNGILGAGQDIGFYNPASLQVPGGYPLPEQDPSRYADPNYWGRDNKVLDTEDLEGIGTLDTTNSFYRFDIPLQGTSGTAPDDFTIVNFPLTSGVIVDPTNINQRSIVPGNLHYYDDIRLVRVWIDQAEHANGKVTIESIQFKGNKWQVRTDPQATLFGVSLTVDTNKMSVESINSLSASGVAPPGINYEPNIDFFRVQVDADKSREQALQLEYAITAQDQTNGKPNYMSRRNLTTGAFIDMGNYKNLRLDIFKPITTLAGEILLVRMGVDDSNYFEYHIYLDDVPVGQWYSVTLALDGSDGKRSVVGQPYLRNLLFVAFAPLTSNQNLNTNISLRNNKELLWLDNLRLTDAIAREGTAYKINTTYDFGVAQIVEDYREVDSDFIRIDMQADPPQRKQRIHTVSGSSNAVSWLPLNVIVQNRQSFTEQKNVQDPLYSRNFIDPDQDYNKVDGTVNFNLIPKLTVTNKAMLETYSDKYLQAYIDSQHALAILQKQDNSFSPNNDKKNLVFNQIYNYSIPDKIWIVKNDQINFDWTFSENTINYEFPTVDSQLYKNIIVRTRLFNGAYSGQYRLLPGLAFSPSYAYSYRDAQGNITNPSPTTGYYQLGPNQSTFDPVTGQDRYEPQLRTIKPDITLQYDKGFVLKASRLGYHFLQSRDYVANENRSSGSLEFATNIVLADLLGGFKVPEVAFTQTFGSDSVITNLPRARNANDPFNKWFYSQPQTFRDRYLDNPNNVSGLAVMERQSFFQGQWWTRLEDFSLGENLKDPLNIENIAASASKRSNSQFTTRFDLPIAPGWTGSMSPRLTFSQKRDMLQAYQAIQQNQIACGTGMDFREPAIFFASYFHPTNLNVSVDYSGSDSLDSNGLKNTAHSTYAYRVTLPSKPTEKLSLTLNYDLAQATDSTFYYDPGAQQGAVANQRIDVNHFSQNPSIQLNYYLDISKTVKLWDIWPLSGRELKIRHSFKLDNLFSLKLEQDGRGSQNNIPPVDTTLYTLRNQISYNLLENVTAHMLLEQNLFKDNIQVTAINGDFYSIKFVLGLAAIF